MLDTIMCKQTTHIIIAERDVNSHNSNPVLAKPTMSKLK